MKFQHNNAQLDYKLMLKACGLKRSKERIYELGLKLTNLEKFEMMEKGIEALTSEQILLQDRRFRVFMLIKSLMFKNFEKGKLSLSSFEIISEACDKAVESKERAFWAVVLNSLPSVKFLKKVENFFFNFGRFDFFKFFLVNKLTLGFEIATVIDEGFENVKREKFFLDCDEHVNDLVMEELEDILQQVKPSPNPIFLNSFHKKKIPKE